MKRFIEGVDREQSTLFQECLEDWVDEENPVRVIDVFVDELDLLGLGFDRVEPEATGRPGYHPSVMLKLYIYGYLNRIQSSLLEPHIPPALSEQRPTAFQPERNSMVDPEHDSARCRAF